MGNLYRFLSGVISAFIGVVIAFVVNLFSGQGIQLNPISDLLQSLAFGWLVGFFFGLFFHRLVGAVFRNLGRFGFESST
jgi:hypothetical protein